MGRRSRQRASASVRERTPARTSGGDRASAGERARDRRPPAPPPRPQAPPTTAARRSRRDSAPEPPWGGFPLVELCALSAIVLGVWGILRGGHGGAVLLTAAMFLGSVAGLEVAIREHLGGYRSHTLLLSGVCAIAAVAIAFFADAPRTTLLVVAGGALLLAIPAFRQLFKRRSGGAAMRVR
jgi:hypothetical protein